MVFSNKKRSCRFGRKDGIAVSVLHPGDMITSAGCNYRNVIFRVEEMHAKAIYLSVALEEHVISPWNRGQIIVVNVNDGDTWLRVTKEHYDCHLFYLDNEAERRANQSVKSDDVVTIDESMLAYKAPKPFTHIPVHHAEGKWDIPVEAYHDTIAILASGQRIKAIKRLRESVNKPLIDGHIVPEGNMGLKAAKEIVDSLNDNMGNLVGVTSEVHNAYADMLLKAVDENVITREQYLALVQPSTF